MDVRPTEKQNFEPDSIGVKHAFLEGTAEQQALNIYGFYLVGLAVRSSDNRAERIQS